jgi:hypothetical protein
MATYFPTDVARDIYRSAVKLRNMEQYNAKVDEISHMLCYTMSGILVDNITRKFWFTALGEHIDVRVEKIFSCGPNERYIAIDISDESFILKCTYEDGTWTLKHFEDNSVDLEVFFDVVMHSFLTKFNA